MSAKPLVIDRVTYQPQIQVIPDSVNTPNLPRPLAEQFSSGRIHSSTHQSTERGANRQKKNPLSPDSTLSMNHVGRPIVKSPDTNEVFRKSSRTIYPSDYATEVTRDARVNNSDFAEDSANAMDPSVQYFYRQGQPIEQIQEERESEMPGSKSPSNLINVEADGHSSFDSSQNVAMAETSLQVSNSALGETVGADMSSQQIHPHCKSANDVVAVATGTGLEQSKVSVSENTIRSLTMKQSDASRHKKSQITTSSQVLSERTLNLKNQITRLDDEIIQLQTSLQTAL